MTVSRVINGGAGVRAETRQRVEQVVADLNYVPSRVARGLTSNKSGTLGLIVPDVVNPFFAQIVAGIEQRLFTLPDDTIVHPGHGLATTIGAEQPSLPEWIARGY